MPLYMSGGQGTASGASPYLSTLFETRSLLSAAAYPRLTGQGVSKDCPISNSCFAIGVLKFQMNTKVPSFRWVLGTQTQVATLAHRSLYPLNPSPSIPSCVS